MKIGMLRQDIELIRPGVHGDYPMLFDPVSEGYFRISPETALIISKMDQPYELEVFLERLKAAGLEVSSAEVIELVSFLQQNNLFAPEYGEFERKKQMAEQVKKSTLLLRIASVYMFFKLPPIHPDRFFRTIAPYVDFLASRWFLTLVLIPAVLGYILMIRDFSAVRSMFLDSLSWAGLAKYFVAIVGLKVIHEASHSLAAMHFKCRVRAIGVSFIVFYPRIFTDTTDSWRLPLRQRTLIDCAGILGELIVGGIAALLWCYLPPGPMKSTMFYIFAVSSLSTLLVNGNPLIRYDGYYILCDLLNIENLMGNSADCLKRYWRYYFFGLGEKPSESRRGLLLAFGIASFLYRIVLYTSIIMIVYHSFIKVVAVILLILEVYTLAIFPLYREIKTIRTMSKRAAARANWWWSILTAAIVLVVLFFPLSWNITLPGEIVAEKSELISIEESGFLASPWPKNTVRLKAGDLIYQLENPMLEFNRQKVVWTHAFDNALFELQQLDRETFSDSQVTEEKLKSDELGLREFRRRKGNLIRRAPAEGNFVPRRTDISKGFFFPPGMVVGELVSDTKMVYAYATDQEVRKLRANQRVEVIFPDRYGVEEGEIQAIAQIPAKLRNSPLLQNFGGPLPVYRDENSLSPEYNSVMALYRIEVRFDRQPEVMPGRTVRVKVLHKEVLGEELYNLVMSVFRREF